MTHFPSKRLPRPGAVPAAVAGPPTARAVRADFEPRGFPVPRPHPAAAAPARITRSCGPRKRSGGMP